ncbi:plasmid partition protein ParG [Rhizobium metallidurans]|uniref:Putative DNA binding CopG/RHH family protein n=1 Tax=Rhizobium metallidurans TaxID=1265931 RepID=A0A7W6CU29_9HYPH|nr:putative DNA binding CopG/RHH family protein [Rhizobium metallidurans]
MSKKTVTMKMPIAKPTAAADAWVGETTVDVSEGPKPGKVVPLHAEVEANKRLTIDVTENLHKRIKAQCAMRGTKMADVIRELLEKEFAA